MLFFVPLITGVLAILIGVATLRDRSGSLRPFERQMAAAGLALGVLNVVIWSLLISSAASR